MGLWPTYTYFPRFLIAKTAWGHFFCTYPDEDRTPYPGGISGKVQTQTHKSPKNASCVQGTLCHGYVILAWFCWLSIVCWECLHHQGVSLAINTCICYCLYHVDLTWDLSCMLIGQGDKCSSRWTSSKHLCWGDFRGGSLIFCTLWAHFRDYKWFSHRR